MKHKKILLLKSIIYRPYSEFITFLIAWAITGQIKVSIAIGLADLVLKIFSYFIFDLFWNKFVVDKYKPCVIWLTGLSGAGKTTIANRLFAILGSRNVKCIILDGDEIRDVFSNTGFDKESRIKHNINVGYMASVLERQGYIVIVSLVSPYTEARDKCRVIARKFIETYISTSLEVCEQRDVKGLYKKARAGQIKDFTGIGSVYEEPANPELTISTDEKSLDKCCDIILNRISR